MDRFRILLTFFIKNKKLINSFIRANTHVINGELKQLAIKIPEILEFDTKRIIWRLDLKRLSAKYRSEQMSVSIRRDQAF